MLGESGLAYKNAGLRRSYLNWLLNERIPREELWGELKSLLPHALRSEGYDDAETILDAMEVLAQENAARRREFITLLSVEANYSPAWEAVEAEGALIRMYELDGCFTEAADLLRRRFYRLRNAGDEHQLYEAGLILDHIASFALDGWELDSLRKLLEAGTIPGSGGSSIDKLVGGIPVSILYVGGNETQAAYEQTIRDELTAKFPGLRIEFYLPGWTSSWNVHLDKVRPLVQRADIVVLSVMVRTQFGRHVRRMCGADTTWLACTGRGKQPLLSSIERAAIWAADRKQKGHGQ